MREKDPHFAMAVDAIEKGIEQSLQKLINNKEIQLKDTGSSTNKTNS